MGEAPVEVSNRCLTLTLDDGAFALDITNMREVLEFKGVTKVPPRPRPVRAC